jgi:hypothetical protein
VIVGGGGLRPPIHPTPVLQRVGVMDRTVLHLPAAVDGFVPWEGGGQK